jgi:hypothetical protein
MQRGRRAHARGCLHPRLSHSFTPGIFYSANKEVLETWRKRVRQRIEILKYADERRLLRSLISIFNLERDANSAVENHRRVYAFRADFCEDSSIGLLDDD